MRKHTFYWTCPECGAPYLYESAGRTTRSSCRTFRRMTGGLLRKERKAPAESFGKQRAPGVGCKQGCLRLQYST